MQSQRSFLRCRCQTEVAGHGGCSQRFLMTVVLLPGVYNTKLKYVSNVPKFITRCVTFFVEKKKYQAASGEETLP